MVEKLIDNAAPLGVVGKVNEIIDNMADGSLIQTGLEALTLTSGFAKQHIDFPKPFTRDVRVICSCYGNSETNVVAVGNAADVTTTGFTAMSRCVDYPGNGTVGFYWIAIGH